MAAFHFFSGSPSKPTKKDSVPSKRDEPPFFLSNIYSDPRGSEALRLPTFPPVKSRSLPKLYWLLASSHGKGEPQQTNPR